MNRQCWWNPYGYSCVHVRNEKEAWIFTKAIFDFRLHDTHPATLQIEPRTFIQPDRHFETDKGSIPVALRNILPSDRYEIEMIFHDSPYQRCDAHGAGYWVCAQLEGRYEWRDYDRRTVDDLLRASMQIETERVWIPEARQWLARDRQHATPAMAATVWAAVRAFGPRW